MILKKSPYSEGSRYLAIKLMTRKRRRESVYLCYRPIFSNDLPPMSLRGRFVGLKERDQLKLH